MIVIKKKPTLQNEFIPWLFCRANFQTRFARLRYVGTVFSGWRNEAEVFEVAHILLDGPDGADAVGLAFVVAVILPVGFVVVTDVFV